MFNLRRLLGLVILISVIVLTGVIFRHLQQQRPEEILNLLPTDVDLALEELHYTQNEDGQQSWTLDATKAEYQRESSLASLEDVQLLLYQAKDFGSIHLQADRGQLLQSTQQVDLWGDVRLKTDRGDQLFTERLHYDDQASQLSSEEPFRFLSPEMELTGVGFQIEVEQGRMLVKKDVRVLLYPEGVEKK